MDYKYIEQLIDRYFRCETTLQEEQILKTFFAQTEEELPQQLRQYQSFFMSMQPTETLGDDFDERIQMLTEENNEVVKARVVSFKERLRPLFRAVAIVAVVITLGNALNLSFQHEQPQGDEINYAAYKDTYEDPAVAYDKVEDALQLISEGFSYVHQSDSLYDDSLYTQVR